MRKILFPIILLLSSAAAQAQPLSITGKVIDGMTLKGVGFALIVEAKHAPAAAAKLRELGETVAEIGEVVEGTGVVRYA